MIKRLLFLINDYSFFLFGPRSTGKSTLIESLFEKNTSLFINLLNTKTMERLERDPSTLKEQILALPPEITHIIIDEIQKIPVLLDIVHDLIESSDKIFILTGSSARKLKHGGANLLAGRAFVFHLHPLSFLEIEADFVLSDALHWGLLPKVYSFTDPLYKRKYLEAYTHTYLKEEIWAEQFIRHLAPFRRFLEVAAQCNGKIINMANIARDVGTVAPTIENYYSILEDTLIGFFLHGFQHSFRKRLSTKPKFYFFDIGVTRALAHLLNIPVVPGNSYYGEVFEHLVILESVKLASYYHSDYRFFYLQTKNGAEIDLVVERPGLPLLFIEIKSATQVDIKNLHSLIQLTQDFEQCEAVCFSNDPDARKIDHVTIFPWQEGIKKYFS